AHVSGQRPGWFDIRDIQFPSLLGLSAFLRVLMNSRTSSIEENTLSLSRELTLGLLWTTVRTKNALNSKHPSPTYRYRLNTKSERIRISRHSYARVGFALSGRETAISSLYPWSLRKNSLLRVCDFTGLGKGAGKSCGVTEE